MKSDSHDEIKSYSQAAYSWLMLITNYYKRVNELDLNIDEMMTLNTVSAHWLYKINSKDEKSYNDLSNMPDDEIEKYFSGSRLSILSIANILGQPKESTRRRVQKLIDYQLLKKDENNGIMLGENYTILVSEFADKTASELYRLTNRLGKINWYQNKDEEIS
jgi:hypothetical protein